MARPKGFSKTATVPFGIFGTTNCALTCGLGDGGGGGDGDGSVKYLALPLLQSNNSNSRYCHSRALD